MTRAWLFHQRNETCASYATLQLSRSCFLFLLLFSWWLAARELMTGLSGNSRNLLRPFVRGSSVVLEVRWIVVDNYPRCSVSYSSPMLLQISSFASVTSQLFCLGFCDHIDHIVGIIAAWQGGVRRNHEFSCNRTCGAACLEYSAAGRMSVVHPCSLSGLLRKSRTSFMFREAGVRCRSEMSIMGDPVRKGVLAPND